MSTRLEKVSPVIGQTNTITDQMQARADASNCEIFYVPLQEQTKDTCFWHQEDNEPRGAGWYYWCCSSGCLPEGDPIGPFKTSKEAFLDAEQYGYINEQSVEEQREELTEQLTELLDNEHGGCTNNTCIINQEMMEQFPTHIAEDFCGSGAASRKFQRLTRELLATYEDHHAQILKECNEICSTIAHHQCKHCNAVIWDFDGQYSENDSVHCDSCGNAINWQPEKETK